MAPDLIVRLMAEPTTGLAPPSWQYGGRLGPAPPVLLVRADGFAFDVDAWAALDDYMCGVLEEGAPEPGALTPTAFGRFLQGYRLPVHNGSVLLLPARVLCFLSFPSQDLGWHC